MCMSSPRAPAPPPAPPPVPASPTRDDPEMVEAQRSARRRRIAAQGRSSTMLTGGQGVTEEANLGQASLLGR